MARHDLLQGELSEHVATAVTALKDGYVIVAPLEYSYALITDAFMHDAVRAMHVLRGDSLGVAAQVAIANQESIDGIAREISRDARLLMQNFWPGLLSLNLKPQAETWFKRRSMKSHATVESPSSPEGSWKRFFPFLESERFVCIPLPLIPAIGFGRKQAVSPLFAAI